MNKATTKRMLIMLAIAAVVMGGVIGFQTFKSRMIAKAILGAGIPPQTVATAVATVSSWQPTVDALGNLRADQQATLSTEVGGLVTAIHFSSGATAHAGQPLVELDPAPLRAQLAQAQAQAHLAEINLARDRSQLSVQAISQAQVDTDTANLEGARAAVKAQQALLAQRLIVAPFAGRLGIRQVDPGQYLAPGAAIVTLQKLDPMQVDFTVPQSQVDLVHVGMKATLACSCAPGHTFDATVEAVEPQIDAATRNLKVRARVPNRGGALLPGAFATVTLRSGAAHDYVTLPNAAISYNPFGATVYVVEHKGAGADGKPRLVAQQRFVTTGMTRGDQVAIVSGVKAGETVVTAGQLKLHNGSVVLVDNTVRPADSANPQVPNS